MTPVEYVPRAERDLDEIWFYIAETSPDRADAFVDELAARLALLAHHPSMGPERPELGAGYRCLPLGDYLAYYRITEHAVRIIRVLHGSRDVGRHF